MRVALPRTRSWGLSCIPRPVRQLAASLAWLSLLALPKAADACSYATVVIESSYPEAGARDVPTNAMLFVSGPLDGPGLRLEKADGTPVAIEVLELDPSGFDVKPLAELEPHQAYVLRAPGPTELGPNPLIIGGKFVEFTTGDGPAAATGPLTAPELGNVAQLAPSNQAACGGSQLCADAEVPVGTTLEVRIEDEVIQIAAPGPWLRTYGSGIGDGECLTVSVRDFTGQRSLPTSVCKDAIPDVPATDPPLTCENYAAPRASSAAEPQEVTPAEAGVGCSLGPPRPGPTLAWTCSGLLGAWLYRRARRAPRAN